ncbi:hypothetical protein [Chitinimonas koreensis]|uniref:hypothetical protein n=1 Tax=Chitinimonas koreensis TaxID=356302 RepID=UPI0016547F30|nr:hypothetical protein [Chitinimonas koreensis]QNM95466.1 hypothetical protein H9L41_16560 [Chitinimonas koreensis]
MTNELHTDDMASWEQFVITHGWKAWAYDLAAVLGQSVQEIERVRSTGACTQLRTTKRFAELFTLWHGRQPTDDEWPMPFRYQRRGTYEWQPPELALLAGLVGQLGVADIAKVLTSRLRTRTNDPEAERTPTAVQNQIGRIGLQSKDVLGGLTTADAGRDVGALSVVQQAIRSGQLSTINIGPRRVVPFDIWERWKAKRTLPPQGYVRLSTLRTPLAIRSDKLSEYARMGYVPTAIRCNTYGAKGPSTQFGTWYIDEKLAVELVAARRAGRPMPWHGKPLIDNLRKTFQLWEERKHPPTCKTCIEIWGEVGVPRSFDDYLKHYPPWPTARNAI